MPQVLLLGTPEDIRALFQDGDRVGSSQSRVGSARTGRNANANCENVAKDSRRRWQSKPKARGRTKSRGRLRPRPNRPRACEENTKPPKHASASGSTTTWKEDAVWVAICTDSGPTDCSEVETNSSQVQSALRLHPPQLVGGLRVRGMNGPC